MFQIHNTLALVPSTALIDVTKQIAAARTVEEACNSLVPFFDALGGELLSVKFYDREDSASSIRPFIAYSEAFLNIAAELMTTGGCPFSKEAKKFMCSFDSDSIDQSQYSSFTERRFFKELSRTGHKHIAVLPVMMGRGIALATVGLYKQPFYGALREKICNSIPAIIAAFLSRFPEINTFFEKKALSVKERRLLQMMFEGCSKTDIAKKMELSEHTILLLIKNAMRKLNAKSEAQFIYRAMVLGEITLENHHSEFSLF